MAPAGFPLTPQAQRYLLRDLLLESELTLASVAGGGNEAIGGQVKFSVETCENATHAKVGR